MDLVKKEIFFTSLIRLAVAYLSTNFYLPDFAFSIDLPRWFIHRDVGNVFISYVSTSHEEAIFRRRDNHHPARGWIRCFWSGLLNLAFWTEVICSFQNNTVAPMKRKILALNSDVNQPSWLSIKITQPLRQQRPWSLAFLRWRMGKTAAWWAAEKNVKSLSYYTWTNRNTRAKKIHPIEMKNEILKPTWCQTPWTVVPVNRETQGALSNSCNGSQSKCLRLAISADFGSY